ncbi:MAG: 2-amino-4-hydroxy-6-hydroxymethyldihydropteridine diphosphokinase [Janthinobacterium lividum]
MIYISIGSNSGNRFLNIRRALNLLKSHGFVLLRQSIIFETQAILPPNADSSWDKPYFNMVVQGTTALLPNALLTVLKKIEQQIGRKENYDKW